MLLLKVQGEGVDTWSAARHAYECCKAYGGDGLMTVSEYAERKGTSQQNISYQVSASQLAEECTTAVVHLSVKSARQIATLPRSDWQWFTDYVIKKELSEKEHTAAIAH